MYICMWLHRRPFEKVAVNYVAFMLAICTIILRLWCLAVIGTPRIARKADTTVFEVIYQCMYVYMNCWEFTVIVLYGRQVVVASVVGCSLFRLLLASLATPSNNDYRRTYYRVSVQFVKRDMLCLRRRVIETFKRQFPSLSTDTLNSWRKWWQQQVSRLGLYATEVMKEWGSGLAKKGLFNDWIDIGVRPCIGILAL